MERVIKTDRYVTFCGIECDQWADELFQRLKSTLHEPDHPQWQHYFSLKFEEQQRMKHDNLFFIGAQMNNLYTYFEEIEDQTALDLLWKLEQDCC